MSSNSQGDTSWFVHDRFGLFIHWGTYSAAARHEWVKNRERIDDKTYQRYFDHFDPDLYDPETWATIARKAGMKYFVVTTKHHEGFCLWDSQFTDYKATNTPAGRDLLRPLVDAFRGQGFKVGFYYSLLDWHHPEYPVDPCHPQRDDDEFIKKAGNRDVTKYAEYMRNQVRELLTNYGKVNIMWFDFSFPKSEYRGLRGKGKDDWQSEELMALVRELQPGILVNNRLDIKGDFVTPEQVQPREHPRDETGALVVWEACQTLNGSWGYHRDNLDWKSVDMLIWMLIDTVSKGGNLLLNVGPNARGEFEPRAVATLEGIGNWMRLHSRSIYGCGQSEFEAPKDCRFTQNGKRLYLHILSWPFKQIYLDGLAGRVEYAQLLNDASEVRVTPLGPDGGEKKTLVLELPVQKPDVVVPVVEFFLK